MIRKIKVLGLAFVAIMAFSSLVAAAARAAEEQVHIDANPAIVTGQNEIAGVKKIHTLTNGQIFTIECNQATLEGTSQEGIGQEQTPSDIEVTATYGGCQVFGVPATVQMNGCKYTITGAEQGTGHPTTAEAKVTGCTTGKVIQVVTSAGCNIDIPEQGFLNHIVFENKNPGAGLADETQTKDLIVNATVSGVTFQETGAFCPGGNNHQGTNAQFAGETTVRAYEDTQSQEQLTDMGHQFTRHICGTQVGIFAD